MLHLLDQLDPSDPALRDALADHARTVAAPRGRGDVSLVARVEAEVKADPARHLRFDETGRATLRAAGRTFQAGLFETPRLGELRRRTEEARVLAGHPAARLRLFVLDGTDPATDVGALQAHAPAGTLFQVASQFNCLEATGPYVTPVAAYLDDPTQGPRASISAFPGTFVRHYAAPGAGGARFVQATGGPALDLLEGVTTGAARVTNGYLMTSNIDRPHTFAAALEGRFDEIRTGVHDGVEVVFGHDWDGPVPGAPHHTIAQVFSSSVAAGGYSHLRPRDTIMGIIVQKLQRAAHLGALLGAASLGKSYAVMTLVGGGVFGNPIPAIWEALLWAVDTVTPLLHRDLVVVINGRSLRHALPSDILRQAAAARGGALLVLDRGSVAVEVG